jgi:hypothetical protein
MNNVYKLLQNKLKQNEKGGYSNILGLVTQKMDVMIASMSDSIGIVMAAEPQGARHNITAFTLAWEDQLQLVVLKQKRIFLEPI